jgi:hypothetical protein
MGLGINAPRGDDRVQGEESIAGETQRVDLDLVELGVVGQNTSEPGDDLRQRPAIDTWSAAPSVEKLVAQQQTRTTSPAKEDRAGP